MSEIAKCALCGEPMPHGEEMFKYHGYSGDCPKPPLSAALAKEPAAQQDHAKIELPPEVEVDPATNQPYGHFSWRELYEQMRAAAVALQERCERAEAALKHIKWIKDCGIDSGAGNHPDAERDAMYSIADKALKESGHE